MRFMPEPVSGRRARPTRGRASAQRPTPVADRVRAVRAVINERAARHAQRDPSGGRYPSHLAH
jgi:hypothetical protein